MFWMNAYISESTTVIMQLHSWLSQKFLNPVFDTFFSRGTESIDPPRLPSKYRPAALPPTSGSRISITWLSGAFLPQQKADPAGWDGNRVRGWDRTGDRSGSEISRHTHTLTKPNITTWIFTHNTQRGKGGWCLTPPDHDNPWGFDWSLLSHS